VRSGRRDVCGGGVEAGVAIVFVHYGVRWCCQQTEAVFIQE
jgi:hypothetical protein